MAKAFRYEIVVECAGKPEIDGILADETDALQRAHYLLSLAKFTAVRVVRLSHRGSEKIIFDKTSTSATKAITISNLDSSNVCTTVYDIYTYQSRRTLVRLLRSYCDETCILPIQFLHRYLMLRQAERDGSLFNLAINRLAGLQGPQLGVTASVRVDALLRLFRDLLDLARTAESEEGHFARLRDKGMSALIAEANRTLAPGPRDRAISYALARLLEPAVEWDEKLVALTSLLTPSCTPEALAWIDEACAETMDGAAPIKSVLGYAPDLASALAALTLAADGAWNDHYPGRAALAGLSRALALYPLPATRSVLLERIAKAMDSPAPLTRAGRAADGQALRALIGQLREFGGFKGGSAMCAAITRRAKVAFSAGPEDLSWEDATGRVVALLPCPADRAGYYLDLLASPFGQQHATRLTNSLARVFGAIRHVSEFLPLEPGPPIEDVLTGFRVRLFRGGIPTDLADRLMRRLEHLAKSQGAAPIRPVQRPARNADDETLEMVVRRPPAGPQLTFVYRGLEITYPASEERFLLGRSSECDLIVSFEGTSRTHAVVEWKDQRATLTDKSRNGTYLATDGTAPVVVHNDSATLAGAGSIFLGPDPGEVPGAENHIIRYRVVE